MASVAYHRVGDGSDSLPDRATWEASTEAFAGQMAFVKRNFDVISPRVRGRRGPQPESIVSGAHGRVIATLIGHHKTLSRADGQVFVDQIAEATGRERLSPSD